MCIRDRAFVVLKPEQRLSDDAIIAHCQAQIARYKVPKSVIFIDKLPRNAAGKVVKDALRQMDAGR